MKINIQHLLVLASLTLSIHPVDVYASQNSEHKLRVKKGHTSVTPPAVHGLYDFYEVSGNNAQELQNDLSIKAVHWSDGNKYDSVTRWKIGWDYEYDRAEGMCAAGGFRLTVDIIVSIPAWLHRNTASAQLIEKWDAYIEKLRSHEHEHLEKVIQAADDLTRAIAEMTPSATCRELDRQIRQLSRNRLEQLEQEQNGYDVRTAHGWTQGALFP